MKRLLLILLCVPLIGFGQQKTYVPDDNFEQNLINLGYDNVLDDSVLTANINTVTYLNVSYSIYNPLFISDLTGIEDFDSLWFLNCGINALTNLDVSQNTALTTLICEHNPLGTLDVSNNTTLYDLRCNNNQLTNLDVSQNTALNRLQCRDNQLTLLDLQNLDYFNLDLDAKQNPALICVEVSDSIVATNALSSGIDSWSHFSEDCNYVSGIEEYSTNKELLKVTDILGREVNEIRNTPLFYIYNDGTVEKKMIIE